MCAERKICPGAVKAPGHFLSVTLFAGLVAPGLGLFNGDLSWVLHVAAAWAAVVLGAALRNPDQGVGSAVGSGGAVGSGAGDAVISGVAVGSGVCVFSIELPMAPITTKATTSQNHHLL